MNVFENISYNSFVWLCFASIFYTSNKYPVNLDSCCLQRMGRTWDGGDDGGDLLVVDTQNILVEILGILIHREELVRYSRLSVY